MSTADRGRPAGMGFWLRGAEIVLTPIIRLLYRQEWRGASHVPATGGVIVVANHISHFDPLTLGKFLVVACGRAPRFLAKAQLFSRPFIGTVFRGAGQIPVHRGTSDAAASLVPSLEALARGECVVIYPEGTVTRDPDQWPMTARTGAARLALESGAPIVPVGMWGTQRIRGKGWISLRPGQHSVVVAGPPVDLSRFAGRPQTAELLRAATDAVMTDVRGLVEGLRGERSPAEVWDMKRGHRVARAATEPPDLDERPTGTG